MNRSIRLATAADYREILNIYAPYVRDTAVTFETQVPTPDEFSARIGSISKQYPYLVYETDGKIVGYAYASKHMERAAYRYDVDVSIYVSPEYHGSGAAHKLYACLFSILKELGYYNAYAGCTLPNEKSIGFHKKLGFSLIGVHHKTGYKLGRWHDVAWFEKTVMPHSRRPFAIKSAGELSRDFLESVFRE